MPAFAFDGGMTLVLSRGTAVIGLLLAFGALVHAVFVAPKALAGLPPGRGARV